ncbi:MAG: hypothetical protein UX62_C0001G0013 [Microgenomates group bacterium GW2011_GWA2_46_7]|nr:MAG: hypothetical protein UX64_C0011G0002 [Microgenomates group bacterium GW2011_GWC2_46_7]KKU47010.1 MAG: hypothetical protein UX62_C0001G0013 [Microgenomates group bacterium GW2011_GWA2_46_7]
MTMKLRKNDLLEIQKGGKVAILAKLVEFKAERAKLAGLKMKNELKNLREPKIIRRAVAELHTLLSQIKETK